MMELTALVVLGVSAIVGVVMALRSSNYDISLDSSIQDKIKELPRLFQTAKDKIRIATDFDPEFFDDLRVRNSLEKALANGARVQFISEAEPVVWYENKDGIEIQRVDTLKHHTMTIDSRHVRLERPHAKSQFGKAKGDVALIFTYFPELGRKISEEFDELWTTCS